MVRIAAAALSSVIIGAVVYTNAFSPSGPKTCPVTETINRRESASLHPLHPRSSVRLQSIFFDDFEDFSSTSDDFGSSSSSSSGSSSFGSSFSDGDLFASLRARQDALKEESIRIEEEKRVAREGDMEERERLKHNWNEANCLSTVRLTLDDWIRRLSVDLYPLVVCGSSRGNLYLGDLEEGEELDRLEGVHSDTINPEIPRRTADACIQALYDGYDGNGPFAVAVKNDLVVSSGREGGIHACTIVGNEMDVYTGSRGGTVRETKLQLQPEGPFRGLKGHIDMDGNRVAPPIITSLAFDERGHLWAGGYDGRLRAYDHEELDEEDKHLMLRQKRPDFDIDVGSPIVDINIVDETGIIVVSTETQGVFLYSLHDGRFLLQIDPFAPKRRVMTATEPSRQFTRTAMIVRNDNSTTFSNQIEREEPGSGALLVIGGSYGHLYQVPISIVTDDQNPSRTMLATVDGISKIRPKHMGPVVGLASPSPGLFVTASHDGTMRVWDCGQGEDGDDDTDVDESRYEKDITTDGKLKQPKVLYALSGYKVWLGSVFANNRKLVSDGADNTVIVHSFEEDEETILRSQQEDDEEKDDDREGPFSSMS